MAGSNSLTVLPLAHGSACSLYSAAMQPWHSKTLQWQDMQQKHPLLQH